MISLPYGGQLLFAIPEIDAPIALLHRQLNRSRIVYIWYIVSTLHCHNRWVLLFDEVCILVLTIPKYYFFYFFPPISPPACKIQFSCWVFSLNHSSTIFSTCLIVFVLPDQKGRTSEQHRWKTPFNTYLYVDASAIREGGLD
jgi:hypothetical protein